MEMPFNHKTERSVLAAAMQKPKLLTKALDRLNHDSFFSPQNVKIWESIKEAYKRHGTADSASVSRILNERGQIDQIGGESYLFQLITETPSTANFDSWVSIVVSDAKSRELIRLGTDISKQLDQSSCPDAVGSMIQARLAEILGQGAESGARAIREGLPEALQRIEAGNRGEKTGIPTGFHALDVLMGNMKAGQLIVLAARPSIGKTALAMNICAGVAMASRIPVGVFSLEMSFGELVDRMIFSEAQISQREVIEKGLSQTEMHMICEAAAKIDVCPIYIDDLPQQTLSQIRAKSTELKAKKKIGFIMIDYIQIMKGEGMGKGAHREQELAAISKGLKALAKDLGLPILVLAQLNRQAEGNERPKLSHLRESGQIEQDADMILFLHRDRRSQQVIRPGESVQTEVIVEKNRGGRCGIATLTFTPDFCRFDNPTSHGGAYA